MQLFLHAPAFDGAADGIFLQIQDWYRVRYLQINVRMLKLGTILVKDLPNSLPYLILRDAAPLLPQLFLILIQNKYHLHRQLLPDDFFYQNVSFSFLYRHLIYL